MNGPFAFAIWDLRREVMFVARDRFGIKPLYLAQAGEHRLIFASEVRGIFASDFIEQQVCVECSLEYLSFQDFWARRTPFLGVRSLQPGACLTISRQGMRERRYWDVSAARDFGGTLHEAREAYRDLCGGI